MNAPFTPVTILNKSKSGVQSAATRTTIVPPAEPLALTPPAQVAQHTPTATAKAQTARPQLDEIRIRLPSEHSSE